MNAVSHWRVCTCTVASYSRPHQVRADIQHSSSSLPRAVVQKSSRSSPSNSSNHSVAVAQKLKEGPPLPKERPFLFFIFASTRWRSSVYLFRLYLQSEVPAPRLVFKSSHESQWESLWGTKSGQRGPGREKRLTFHWSEFWAAAARRLFPAKRMKCLFTGLFHRWLK